MTQTVELSKIDELFAAAGDNAHAAAQALANRLSEYPDTEISHAAIDDFEQRGDHLTGDIVRRLFDLDPSSAYRQQYYTLSTAVDDIVDHIEHVSDLLDLYKVEAAMQQALDQCDVLVRATALLRKALACISDPSEAAELLTQIKAAEDEGDRLERHALAALFENEGINPRVIIQWKDLFEGLEDAIDACERSALVIGNLMLVQ